MTEGTPDVTLDEFDSDNLDPGTLTTLSHFHVRLSSLDIDDRVYIDNLRIATYYEEVVSEIPEGLSGDFNNDDTVDGADFLTWQGGFGDGADLGVWKAHYGGPLSNVAAASQNVPKPISGVLCGTTVLGLLLHRRRILLS